MPLLGDFKWIYFQFLNSSSFKTSVLISEYSSWLSGSKPGGANCFKYFWHISKLFFRRITHAKVNDCVRNNRRNSVPAITLGNFENIATEAANSGGSNIPRRIPITRSIDLDFRDWRNRRICCILFILWSPNAVISRPAHDHAICTARVPGRLD